MESDPSYARFLLDGQMAVVDDYLEVRPEAEERIRALAASGRLTMGPWYILMDEFLVSGETIVRDLQMGLARGAAFGGAMEVGYLPDMFGHVAQMPQILAPGRASSTPWSGGACPRPITKHRLLVGGPRRLDGAGRVPAGRLRQRRRRCPTTPRRWCGGWPTTSSEIGPFLLDRTCCS